MIILGICALIGRGKSGDSMTLPVTLVWGVIEVDATAGVKGPTGVPGGGEVTLGEDRVTASIGVLTEDSVPDKGGLYTAEAVSPKDILNFEVFAGIGRLVDSVASGSTCTELISAARESGFDAADCFGPMLVT